MVVTNSLLYSLYLIFLNKFLLHLSFPFIYPFNVIYFSITLCLLLILFPFLLQTNNDLFLLSSLILLTFPLSVSQHPLPLLDSNYSTIFHITFECILRVCTLIHARVGRVRFIAKISARIHTN